MKRTASLVLAVLTALSAVSCGTGKTDLAETSDNTEAGITLPETAAPAVEGWPETRPCIVHTRFPSSGPVIADVIASDDYGADPEGLTDSTEAIRLALSDCAEKGGGTVFLPAGTYLVSGGITVPSGVVLRGDYRDPDGGETSDPGTVILAYPDILSGGESKAASDPLFTVSSNAGLIGLTVFYPEQSAVSPVPYPYTVRVGDGSGRVLTATLRDLTLINSYYGIFAGSDHEMLETGGLRVCALKKGMVTDRSSDVGFSDDLSFSPRYWENAGGEYRCSAPDALRALLKKGGSALELGQTDDETYSRVRIEGYQTGITVFAPFWGMIREIGIEDCTTGIDVRYLNSYAGILIADGFVEAETAVSSAAAAGAVRLYGVDLTGEVRGKNISVGQGTEALPAFPDPEPPMPSGELIALSPSGYAGEKKDFSEPLQKALDEAGKTGGTVLIPAGIYSLYHPVTVPEGVLLCGSVPIFLRDGTDTAPGTVLLSYVSDQSTVTLSENAGMRGLRLFFPAFDSVSALRLIEKDDPKTKIAAVKGTGKNVYLTDVGITAAFIGADFSGCDGHLLKGVFGCCYLTQAIVGGKGGTVTGCLQNMTFTQRHALSKYFDPDHASPSLDWMGLGAHVRDLVLRPYCTMLTVRNAENEHVGNLFAYAANHLIAVTDSSAVIGNASADFLYGGQFVFENSRGTVINALHSCGGSVTAVGSEVKIRNRIAIGRLYEPDFDSSSDPEDLITWTEKRTVTGCETAEGLKYAALNTDPKLIAEGKGSWTLTHRPHEANTLLEASFSPVSVEGFTDGYLHVSVYVSEYVNLLWGGDITLYGEGGGALSWSFPAYLTRTGWNDVYLPFDSALPSGNFRADRVNGFRVRSEFGADFENVFAFDDIFVCK
ncbi:MAG: hypothetical protein MJ070_05425 [Lachnospiraceae bacterium]|nr:hypothetical protein [Lachnospiraceae bacterium]